MPSLFENAVASIRMGVEDFRQQDHNRDISAVRNFYAGLLLLAKEALIRAAPNADPQLIIGARHKPVPDGRGGIEMSQDGFSTIDFIQISKRAKDFGVELDSKALGALNKIRNDMEHHYTSESETAIRSAISKGFPVAASLFRQIDENPVTLLGDAWTTMLETKELYDQELSTARATLHKIEWYSPAISLDVISCPNCQSELVEQAEPENTNQEFAELHCRTCGADIDLGDVIEVAVDRIYGSNHGYKYREYEAEGPIYRCPACSRATIIEDEECCANCAEVLDFVRECKRCSEAITIQDYLDGVDGGLCSYCDHMHEKIMRE